MLRDPLLVGIEDDEISGGAGGERAVGQGGAVRRICAEVVQLRRVDGHLFEKLHHAQMAGAHEVRDAEGEGGLEADDAARGCEEVFLILLLCAVRRVVGRDAVDGAVLKSFDDRETV